MDKEEYILRQQEIKNTEPSDWDLSSNIAYHMFCQQKADQLQRLDDEFSPSRWVQFKRWFR